MSSPPSLPSSFDPALHLHSEHLETIILSSESHSDELEALHAQQSQTSRELTRKGTVIQHRAWNLSEVFRSDENFSPSMREFSSLSEPKELQVISVMCSKVGRELVLTSKCNSNSNSNQIRSRNGSRNHQSRSCL